MFSQELIDNKAEYKALQIASLFYICIPTILFILGWVSIEFSLVIVALIFIGCFQSLNIRYDLLNVPSKASSILKYYFPTFIISIVAVIFSGIGGFSIQDGDYLKHNAFFLDLTQYSWPLAYQQTGIDNAPRVLNTYLGYYLPSALVGKLFGFKIGYFFSFVWASIGLFLTLLWVNQFVSKKSILYSIIFIFFGELVYFQWEHYSPEFKIFGENIHYASWMSFKAQALSGLFWILGSNHTFLSNGPHHIFPSWIIILMIFHDTIVRKSNSRAGFIYSFTPFVSAFMALGLAPFVLLGIFQLKGRELLTFQNFIIAPLLLLVSGLYLVSNNAQFEQGWIWNFAPLVDIYTYLIRFFIFGFGVYFILMPKGKNNFISPLMRPWLFTSIFCFISFSFYRIGAYMDFPIKAYNPSWIIFQVCLLSSISFIQTRFEFVRGVLLFFLIFIGSIGAISNVKYFYDNTLFIRPIDENKLMHIHHIGPKEKAGAIFSDGQSFFWKYLGKKPVYIE